jgi:hypothetical protein
MALCAARGASASPPPLTLSHGGCCVSCALDANMASHAYCYCTSGCSVNGCDTTFPVDPAHLPSAGRIDLGSRHTACLSAIRCRAWAAATRRTARCSPWLGINGTVAPNTCVLRAHAPRWKRLHLAPPAQRCSCAPRARAHAPRAARARRASRACVRSARRPPFTGCAEGAVVTIEHGVHDPGVRGLRQGV